MVEYEDEGGIGEDSDQSFTMWSRPPIEEDCDIDNTESGMMFFLNLRSFCVPMYMCKINNKTRALLQTTGGKYERTSLVCGYLKGHYNTELRT